jgi:hypothetical protein
MHMPVHEVQKGECLLTQQYLILIFFLQFLSMRIYENNIHLKIEKDIYQVFVLIKDLIKIHVPNYILLFVPQLRLCELHQHSRIFISLKCSHKRKETICIDNNCKKKKGSISGFCVNKQMLGFIYRFFVVTGFLLL